jgi:hypothetical protein
MTSGIDRLARASKASAEGFSPLDELTHLLD